KLRLLEELDSVHDTFYVSNMKKCLADANLHVPLNEIKVDKTLHFVEEPVEIMDREIKRLKRRKVALLKIRWNSKRGPEFTWEHEDQMRIRMVTCGYPWPEIEGKGFAKSGGLLASISGLLSGRRVTCEYLRPELGEKGSGLIQERLRSSAWCMIDWIGLNFMLACIQQDEIKVKKSG
ncbi:hypothetical protein Tco_1142043, partial [Tanacetum coccineum]